MTDTGLSLAQKVDLLFENLTHTDGRRYTYDDVRRLGDVDPSTISRIRSGRIADPAFSNMAGIAEAFGISLDYFRLSADKEELCHYLHSRNEEQVLQQLWAKERRQVDKKVEILAHRASHLDEEGIQAVVGMINYVLNQKGVRMAEETEEVAQS